MELLINLSLLFASFFLMEFVAWFSHKYIMHGFLWFFHEDHHQHSTHLDPFERNDFFFLLFATPGIILILFGVDGFQYSFFIGLGITLYGLAYFLIHDVFIHQRIKWFRKVDNNYFKALRRAHKAHHKHFHKEDGECFGMLIVPRKYFK